MGPAPDPRSRTTPFRGAGARFSADRAYRYALWRVWDCNRGLCNFLPLNPSTADEAADDPTVARCTRRARIWGYGGLVVTNLFAFRATDPVGLRSAPDPVGPEDDAAVVAAAGVAAIVVCAWGNHGAYRGRATAVLALLDGLGVTPYHQPLTRRGQPAHSLPRVRIRSGPHDPPLRARSTRRSRRLRTPPRSAWHPGSRNAPAVNDHLTARLASGCGRAG